MMKKWKTLSVFILGALASIFFVGCSCSEKDVNPTKISVNIAESYTFVGETTSVTYNIEPVDSTNTKVEVSVNKPDVVELSQTSFNAASGKLTLTGKTVDTEGVSVTFSISGTNLKTSTLVKVMPDPVKLNTISGVAYSEAQNAIVFRSVPHTTNYVVNINGTEYPVTDPSTSSLEHFVSLPIGTSDVPLVTNIENVVKVKALGDVMNFTDGDYSLEYKFLKYAPVTNVTAVNGVVSWDAHDKAPLYLIKVNGVQQVAYASTNSFTIPNPQAGEYTIEVAAASNASVNDCFMFKSEYSEPYTITKLATPVLSLQNDNKVDEVITNSFITFPEILGASGYKVTISPALTSGSEFEITQNKLEITNEFAVDTNYEIQVLPVGDVATTIEGESSTILVKRIGAVSNFAISNNVLTFDGISASGGYEVALNDGTTSKTISTQLTSVNLAEECSAVGTYSISVRALGLITETLNNANGETVSSGLTITKLNNVNITAVKNDATVTWNAVDGTNTYAVYLNDSYVSNASSTSYTLSVNDAGEHNVKVVAIGDGTTTITSGLNNATAFNFKKLEAISNFTIENDSLKFTGVTGALDYSVKVNNSAYRLIGNNPEAGYALLDVIDGTNQIYVISVGDGVRNISSSPANLSVTRLAAPTNLRTENGVLTWDAVEGNKYKIFVGDNVDGVEQTTNTFTAINVVNEQVVVKVKAIPAEGNYISSAFTTKTVVKLPTVNVETVLTSLIDVSDTLSNYKLVWGAVANASKYNIEIKNTTETYNYEPTTTEVNLPETYAAGDYAVKLVAVGTTNTDGVGYVTSEATNFNFRKLGTPKNVTVKNNHLVWAPATGDSPAGYTLEITYNEETTYVNVGQETSYLFNPENYKLDMISVRVRSVGDNASLVTGEYATTYVLSRAQAITGLAIKDGVVVWDTYSVASATYQVYATTTPDVETSYTLYGSTITKGENIACEISGLEAEVKYTIKVVAVVEGKLNSEASTTLNITKLATVANFRNVDGEINWDSVANATAYVITDSNYNVKKLNAPQTFVDFADFGSSNPGNYTFKIYAVGSVSESADGYINSQVVDSGLTITILASATGASISDNVLTILNTNDVLPVGYYIEVTHEDGGVEEYTALCGEGGTTVIELKDWTFTHGAGIYQITIYSLGDGENTIDNWNRPLKLEGITKIDGNSLGLKIMGGEIVWNADVNKKFDVYVNGVLTLENLETNKASLTNLEKGVEYNIQIVGKQNGQINSALSSALKVTKLPDVTNFKINQNVLTPETGLSEYYFSWDSLLSSDYDTTKLRFEVVPVTSLEPFNGVVEGNVNTLMFAYNDTTPKTLQFNIRMLGSELEETAGYITGETLTNPLDVTILKSLVFTSYNRETNTINFTNENTNASGIKIAYYNAGTGEYAYTETILGTATSYVVTCPADMPEGVYDVYFNCLGDINNNILMSSTSALTYHTLEFLQQAINVRTENGFVKWTYDGSLGTAYQVYIDGVLLTYTTTEPPAEEGAEPVITTHTTFETCDDTSAINNAITDTEVHEIYIKVIKEGAIDSRPSETMTIQKLAPTTDAKLDYWMLWWSSVTNAEGYVIYCSNADSNLLFAEDFRYNAELGGLYLDGADAGEVGTTLPTTIPSGVYGFYVVPVGNSVDYTEHGYLTGSTGNIVPVQILPNTTGMSVTDGIITWQPVSGAMFYLVEIVKGQTYDSGTYVNDIGMLIPQCSLEDESYAAGWYTVKVTTMGNGVTSLDSSSLDVRTITVYKSPTPNSYDYKVRDGFISWEVPFGDDADEYIKLILEGTSYDANAILAAAQGNSEQSSMELVHNLSHFRCLEVTINNKLFQNQKPASITLNKAGDALVYSYDFNFTNIVNPYTVSLRFIGGSSMLNEEGGGEGGGEEIPEGGEETPVEASVNIGTISNRVLEEIGAGDGSDGGMEGENPEGEGGEETIPETAYSVVSSDYSKTITGYKLSAPQTPMAPYKTMVYNDHLYFGLVDAGSFSVRYLITATAVNPEKANKTLEINSTNASKYAATVADSVGGASNSVYKVPVADIGIERGFVYIITVRAMGTKDSGTNTTGVYFTSLYDHSCSVEMLGTPKVSISDGDIAFANSATAVSQELRIWSVGIGQTFDKSKSNEDAGLYAEQISITSDQVENISFLTLGSDGFFKYTLSDNPLFPVPGAYYVSCEAMGNGVEKISSGQSTKLLVYKFDKVENLTINGGVFSWKAQTYQIDADESVEALHYVVTIIRQVVGDIEGASLETVTMYIAAETIKDGDYCFFDLPSLDFPAVSEDGARYEYALQVAACGTQNSEENTLDYTTVTGDSVQTAQFYKRLLSPITVEMVNGTLRWTNVDDAAKYEVYKLDVLLEGEGGEGEELPEYGIVTDNNYRQLVFNASDFATNKVFSLRVRAIPGILSTQYLNGEFSPEVLCKKLEVPNLRVADGIIKWNNTDLNYAIATGTKIKITQLETETSTTGTVVYENSNLPIANAFNTDTGLDLSVLSEQIGLNLGSGYYKVEVGYLGSNGYYNQVVEPEVPEGGGDSGSGEVPPEGGENTNPEGGGENNGENSGEESGGETPIEAGVNIANSSNRVLEGEVVDGEVTEPENPEDGSGEGLPEDGTGEAPPEGGSEGSEGSGGTETEPEVLSYCWFSSDYASMVVYKLETPQAELYITEDQENPANYIAVKLLENAAYYQFTVVKYSESTAVRTHTFEKIDVDATTDETYYERYTDGSGTEYLLFNVQAVADYDALYPDHSHLFGQEFSIYVRAFSYDALCTDTHTKLYTISDKSNEVAVEVPITPTRLSVDTGTGLITWKNYSNNTKTRIKVYYNESAEPVYYSVDPGVNSFKLETIGTFKVSVLSYITTANSLEITSAYTDEVEGDFKIFASGSGTELDPYMLSAPDHILNIEHYLDSYFKFKNDIAMTSSSLEFVEGFIVGRDGGAFNGTLDGDGHKLTNVYYKYNSNYIAFIKEIGTRGVVKNLSIGIKTPASNSYYVAQMAGITITNRGTISGVTTLPLTVVGGDGEITYTTLSGGQLIAGIAIDNYGTITNTINNMNISYYGSGGQSMSTRVAGIAVNNYNTVTMCGNTGGLKGTLVGGVVNQNLGAISKSYNLGSIVATSNLETIQALAGGIAVRNTTTTYSSTTYTGSIEYCYSIVSNITLTMKSGSQYQGYAAGIVADSAIGTLKGCYVAVTSTGAISASNGTVGMFVGVDNRKSESNYVGNFYVSAVTINLLGNDENVIIATKSSDKTALTASLYEAYPDVYSQDINSINNGYPVFAWQINA